MVHTNKLPHCVDSKKHTKSTDFSRVYGFPYSVSGLANACRDDGKSAPPHAMNRSMDMGLCIFSVTVNIRVWGHKNKEKKTRRRIWHPFVTISHIYVEWEKAKGIYGGQRHTYANRQSGLFGVRESQTGKAIGRMLLIDINVSPVPEDWDVFECGGFVCIYVWDFNYERHINDICLIDKRGNIYGFLVCRLSYWVEHDAWMV